MNKRAFPLLIALLHVLAACGTPLDWDKPGLDSQAKADDQADCRQLAWRQAVGVENDLFFWSRMRSPGYARFRDSAIDRSDLEYRFFSTCMQAKGYRLVPRDRGG